MEPGAAHHYCALPDNDSDVLVEASEHKSVDRNPVQTVSVSHLDSLFSRRRAIGAMSWVFVAGSGQIGLGPRTRQTVIFTTVESVNGHIEDIFAGKDSYVLLSEDRRSLSGWGRSLFGNSVETATAVPLTIPEGRRIVQTAHASYSDAILLDDGEVMVRGYFYPSKAPGGFSFPQPSPMEDPHPPFRKIAVGQGVLYGIDEDGHLWVWGITTFRQDLPRHLFAANSSVVSIPTLVQGVEKEEFVDISCGVNHVAAISVDGRLWTWGPGDKRLGTGLPPYTRDLTLAQMSQRDVVIPTVVAFSPSVPMARVVCSQSTTLALDREGRCWVWGYDSKFLVNASGNDFDRPFLIELPVGVIFRDIAYCERNAYAITTTGDLWVWGQNQHGQLGVGHSEPIGSPLKVRLPEPVHKVVASSGSALLLTTPTLHKHGILKAFVGDQTDLFSPFEASPGNITPEIAAQQVAVSSAYGSNPEQNLSAATVYNSVGTKDIETASEYTFNTTSRDADAPAAQTGEVSFPHSYDTTGADHIYSTISEESTIESTGYKQISNDETDTSNDDMSGLSQREDLPTEGRNWNEEFQLLLSLPCSAATDADSRDRAILQLYEQFVEQSRQLADVIVSEQHLPVSEKTIKPLRVGGVAGGAKYVVNGIFFKFAIDMHGIYGGDEWSRKAASLELAGQDAYLQCQLQIPDIRAPLMAVIDCRGFRLLATCVLPLSREASLVYGSDDGGRTCHMDDPEVNSIMQQCGNILNLKGHEVTEARVKIFAPCDIEVHRATDGRLYVIDCARTYPPEFPFTLFGAIKIDPFSVEGQLVKLELDKGQLDLLVKDFSCTKTNEGLLYYSNTGVLNKTASCLVGTVVHGDAYLLYGLEGRILYYQLRPEFVRSYPKPLSPDGCSMFGRFNAKENNAEIKEATIYLRQVVIPQFASALDSNSTVVSSAGELIRAMHAAGINLRYLGNVRFYTSSKRLKRLLFSEMICRVLKNLVNRRMRAVTLRSAELSDLRVELIKLFNQLFGNTSSSDFFWTQLLKVLLLAKYKDCLQASELERAFDLRELVNVHYIFQIVQYRTGIVFTIGALAAFSGRAVVTDQARSEPFQVNDILSVQAVCKRMRSVGSPGIILTRLARDETLNVPANPFAFMASAEEYSQCVLAPHRNLMTRVQVIFGDQSRELANEYLNFALLCSLRPSESNCQTALASVQAARNILLRLDSCSFAQVVLLYHALGRVCQCSGEVESAARMYLICMGAMLQMSGETPDTFRRAEIQENGLQVSLHPMSILILNQLSEIFWDKFMHADKGTEFSRAFECLLQLFPFPGDASARRLVFGSSTIFPLLHLLTAKLQRSIMESVEFEPNDVGSMDGFPITDEKCCSWVKNILSIQGSFENGCSTEVLRDIESARGLVADGAYSFIWSTSMFASAETEVGFPLRYLVPPSRGVLQLAQVSWDGIGVFFEDRYTRNTTSEVEYSTMAPVTTLDTNAGPHLQEASGALWCRMHFRSETDQDEAEWPFQLRGSQRPDPKMLLLSWYPFSGYSLTPIPIEYEDLDPVQVRVFNDPSIAYLLTLDGRVFSSGRSWYLGRDGTDSTEFKQMEGIVGRSVIKMDAHLHGFDFDEQPMSMLFCALTSAGELYSMGNNSSSATGVADDDITVIPRLITQLHGTPIHNFACGASFCVAVSVEGKAFIWGQLIALKQYHWRHRDDVATRGPSVVQPIKYGASPTAIKVESDEKVTWVSAGPTHACLITDFGDVIYIGQKFGAGSPDIVKYSLLELFEPADPTQSVRLKSSACGYAHTLLLSADGRVFAFGDNRYGQLGNGSFSHVPFSSKLAPVEFARSGMQIRPFIVQVVAHEFCSAALDRDGSVWVWGRTIAAPVRVSMFPGQLVRNISFASARNLLLSLVATPAPRPLEFPARSRPRKAAESLPQGASLLLSPQLQDYVAQQLNLMLQPVFSRLDSLAQRLDRVESQLGMK